MSRGSDVFAPLFVPLGYLLRLPVAACTGSGDRFTGSPAKLPAEAGRAVWPLGSVNGPASGDSLGRVERKRPAAKLGVHRAGIFLGSSIDCAVDCRSLVRRTALSREMDGCLVKIGCALSVFAVFFGGIFLFGVDYPDGRGGNLAGAAGSYAEVFLSGCHLLLLPLQWALPAGRISGVVRNPMGYSRVQMTQLGVLILGAIGRS